MENELITVTLSVAQWNSILSVISLAPFSAVNQVSEAINTLQSVAAPQIEAAAAKYPAPEAAEAAE
jgi:hypothetical protein